MQNHDVRRPPNSRNSLENKYAKQLSRSIDKKTVNDREFKFIYIYSLQSNTQFIRKQNASKLQFRCELYKKNLHYDFLPWATWAFFMLLS